MKNKIIGFFVFLVLITNVDCRSSSVKPKSGAKQVAYTESGRTSFYADNLQFKKTASGDLYNHDLKTAAHKNIPFGTKVKVTNVKNGKSVVVTINDRGPFVKGRIVDLSKSAFNSISNTSSGLISVQIEVVS
ncbi:hypothetical protein AU255_08155 [Methyloprofundus sedimenti]|uniref:Endolytic peptidoglycan transglycosylase RlpA n=1 Tax=Methyloprofundus sedimenti TaxID=1420851 RepID=A0A1V8M941_9GAMM|nr:septal ring lytic transglycosylase RlpA family protein [Methyloprofundus sedimenti]OQK17823.1 hypothetical protein AU255_08155 [Methyloprofundus sedimenti]